MSMTEFQVRVELKLSNPGFTSSMIRALLNPGKENVASSIILESRFEMPFRCMYKLLKVTLNLFLTSLDIRTFSSFSF